ncbi:hypothetical protein OGAPHI_000827 [Ogataea philodendri]|uniref:Uncharacterized protein n=1 Tax=Ogataea philodendri TaxID=1378263 RepID=A0A9P8T9Q9_9ASCO|nr:uncharacterized protein OGAPHI_000827 [Ogataea philodendri]KAH3671116.1 hypothetical protein OGAPHI_000827 [Ogataea philodendri]
MPVSDNISFETRITFRSYLSSFSGFQPCNISVTSVSPLVILTKLPVLQPVIDNICGETYTMADCFSSVCEGLKINSVGSFGSFALGDSPSEPLFLVEEALGAMLDKFFIAQPKYYLKFSMFRRAYNSLVPSFVTERHQPRLPLKTKFATDMAFRRVAESRINILRQIIPQQYMLDNHLLYRASYFSENDPLKTRFSDKWGADVRMDLQSVETLGRALLKKQIHVYLFQQAMKSGIDANDYLSQPSKETRNMHSMLFRKRFIDQFLRDLEVDFKLDRVEAEDRIIKLEQSTRAKLLFYLIAFVHYQHGPAKCREFVDEFVILGRLTENYSHKGLLELSSEFKPKFSY